MADLSVIPNTLFKGYTIREGTCKELRASAAILASGEELPFDFCVLAMGSRHTGAGVIQAIATTLAGRREELKAAAASISAAKQIVVVGGGPVGIEVVGEILEQYAGKSLTLIHSGPQLVEGKSLGVHKACMQLMKQHGVKVMLEDKAESWDQGWGADAWLQASKVLTTRSGVKVPADYVIWAAGSSPNTQLLATGALASALDSQGRVKVDPWLRLEGFSHIYAVGDINNTLPAIKLGYLADLQAQAAVKNLAAAAAGRQPCVKYEAPLQPAGLMMLTFGRDAGVFQAGSCVCSGGCTPAAFKGKDLFAGKVRGDLGV
ncbi:hypothetical protein QJQ45_024342 [Haematococcus lacustris]|nr:hypothetical protein QJQ45_024342 [Haematococcus lacustris]